MEQTDSNMGLSRSVCVDHFWKWLCNNVAEVSNQSPSSDQWSDTFNYGLNNVLYYHWCVLYFSNEAPRSNMEDYGTMGGHTLPPSRPRFC